MEVSEVVFSEGGAQALPPTLVKVSASAPALSKVEKSVPSLIKTKAGGVTVTNEAITASTSPQKDIKPHTPQPNCEPASTGLPEASVEIVREATPPPVLVKVKDAVVAPSAIEVVKNLENAVMVLRHDGMTGQTSLINLVFRKALMEMKLLDKETWATMLFADFAEKYSKDIGTKQFLSYKLGRIARYIQPDSSQAELRSLREATKGDLFVVEEALGAEERDGAEQIAGMKYTMMVVEVGDQIGGVNNLCLVQMPPVIYRVLKFKFDVNDKTRDVIDLTMV